MKAYRVEEFGAPITPSELPDPVANGPEIVVDVSYCGLCHSDAHFHEGHLKLGGDAELDIRQIGVTLPMTMGHEIYGHIASYGDASGLTEADVGRPVIVYPWIGCGECEACRSGRDNECPAPQNIGVQRPGGQGDKVVVRDAKFLIDASGVEPTIAGIYACSGLTAFSALEKVPDKTGSVAIIGMGGVGLMALAIAKGVGFTNVIAIDIDDAKLALAKSDYGADFVINSRADDAAKVLADHTGGVGAVVDFVGSDATAAFGIGALRTSGTYIDVGLFGGAIHLPLAILSSRQLNLRGSYVGTPAQLQTLVEHVRAGDIKAIPIRPSPIAHVNEDLDLLKAGKVEGRVVLYHDAEAQPA